MKIYLYMKKILAIITLIFLNLVITSEGLFAQCAMCRASVESSISEGAGVGAGLNAGILYLSLFPYLILGTVAYLWFRNSKKRHAQRVKVSGNYSG